MVRKQRLNISVLLAAGMVFAASMAAHAHEIPDDVTVRMFIKPEGERLHVLIRTPLEAMRDLNWLTVGPGYLDLKSAESLIEDAASLWISGSMDFWEEGVRLGAPRIAATRFSLPTDQSFSSYSDALAGLRGPPLSETTQLFWQQALLDLHLEYPVESDRSRFSIRPAFARLGLRVTTVLFYIAPEGSDRAFEFSGDPGVVRLDPRWSQAALHFVELGFFHILDGFDHLLFLLCLVIPLRRFRALVLVITSFTVAHSITLLGAAFGFVPRGLWFPPLIEMLIAISIVYMAIENIIGRSLEHRWAIAFGFGLVHGFGFSFALQETLQFAGGHLLTSLFSFNVGVELGQLLVIAVLIPAVGLLFRFVVEARMGTIILSVLVGHTAWHWMLDRGALLSRYSWPELTLSTLASGTRWLMAGVILAGLVWLASLWLGRDRPAGDEFPVNE